MTKEQEDWLVAEVMDSMKMSEMSERMTRNWNEQVPHASAHSAVRFSKLIIPS